MELLWQFTSIEYKFYGLKKSIGAVVLPYFARRQIIEFDVDVNLTADFDNLQN